MYVCMYAYVYVYIYRPANNITYVEPAVKCMFCNMQGVNENALDFTVCFLSIYMHMYFCVFVCVNVYFRVYMEVYVCLLD